MRTTEQLLRILYGPHPSARTAHKAACVLIRNKDKVLGVSRLDDHEAFGVPGGKVDHGESFAEAAVRELHEETGLRAGKLKFLFRAFCDNATGDKKLFDTVIFETKPTNHIAQSNEPAAMKWVSWQELRQGPFSLFNMELHHVLRYGPRIPMDHPATSFPLIKRRLRSIPRGYQSIVGNVLVHRDTDHFYIDGYSFPHTIDVMVPMIFGWSLVIGEDREQKR